MCGIVGLFLKNPLLEPELGGHLATMLGTMRDRGPDSAGFAVYGADDAGVKLTLRGPALAELSGEVRLPFELRDTHAVLHVSEDRLAETRAELARRGVTVVGEGRRMELYKE